jgi:hypothetical protein
MITIPEPPAPEALTEVATPPPPPPVFATPEVAALGDPSVEPPSPPPPIPPSPPVPPFGKSLSLPPPPPPAKYIVELTGPASP